MRNLKDGLVVITTAALEIYGVILAGRYFGRNWATLDTWAAAGVLGLCVTSTYDAWWRH